MSFLHISNRHDIRNRENFYNFSMLRQELTPEEVQQKEKQLISSVENRKAVFQEPVKYQRFSSRDDEFNTARDFALLKRQVLGGANDSVRNAFTGDYVDLPIPSDKIFNLYNAPVRANPIGDTAAINDPLRVSEKLASDRQWETGKDFCKNRRTKFGLFDSYGRQANQNSVHWSDCSGDDPMIAIDRDRYIQRMEFDSYAPYQVSIPKGLLL
jgi:hypothetical protein